MNPDVFHLSPDYKKDLKPPVKKPMSGYVAFASEYMRRARETLPKPIAYTELMREASVEWKKLSEAQQKVSILM